MKLIPGRLQNLAEVFVETLLNFVKGVAGDGPLGDAVHHYIYDMVAGIG